MNGAAQQVQIYAFDNSLVQTTRFQLLQWKHALRLEIDTGMTMSGGRKISTHLRRKLKTPAQYPIENILQHITTCIEDIDAQVQTGDYNLQPTAGEQA